jgi:Ca-activated chloride channel family protein
VPAPGDPLAMQPLVEKETALHRATPAPVAQREAAQFGMIGLSAPAASAAPAAPWGREEAIAPPAEPPVTRLDPNARYATTYRPGGAALAAFDAAVSRGQIPTSYKDLVGDFGARYAPALAAPKEGALAVAVDTARAAVGPEGGPLNLRVALASSEAIPARAPLSVHIVLDVSGSSTACKRAAAPTFRPGSSSDTPRPARRTWATRPCAS